MSSLEVFVIIGGITAIVWINWYFFMAQSIANKPDFPKMGKKTPPARKAETTFPSVETNHH